QLRETLGIHQRMVVTIVGRACRPAREPRSLLERGITLTEELRFGNADAGERRAQRRPRACPHSDDRRVGRLDQGDAKTAWTPAAMLRSDYSCSQPPRRAASYDYNISDRTDHRL